MKRVITPAVLCKILCLTPLASAKHHHRHHDDAPSGGNFDYYLLALSWAPNYCAGHPSDHSSECRIGGHTAFVLHGLWPQASRGLIQHEWQKHGTCTGLAAQDYFAKVEQVYKNVHVPEQYPRLEHEQQFNVSDLEKSFAEANHA